MVQSNEVEIPDTGAVFVYGQSHFAGGGPGHFYIREDPVTSLACGDNHTILACESGRTFAFGKNDWGQLGLGHSHPTQRPLCVKSLKPRRITAVAAGRAHSLFVTDRRVFSCGNNSDGQLGLGDFADRKEPEEVLLPNFDKDSGEIMRVAAGADHSVVLTSRGILFAWGANLGGQLGILNGAPSVSARAIKINVPEPMRDIACGADLTVLVAESGTAYTFGGRVPGAPGRITAVSDELLVTSRVGRGKAHLVLLISDSGNLYLTEESRDLAERLDLVPESSIQEGGLLSVTSSERFEGERLKDIACGSRHVIFVTESGRVYTAGEERYSQLYSMPNSKEDDNNREAPKENWGPDWSPELVACGNAHTVVAVTRKRPHSDTDGQEENHNSSHLVADTARLNEIIGPKAYKARLCPKVLKTNSADSADSVAGNSPSLDNSSSAETVIDTFDKANELGASDQKDGVLGAENVEPIPDVRKILENSEDPAGRRENTRQLHGKVTTNSTAAKDQKDVVLNADKIPNFQKILENPRHIDKHKELAGLLPEDNTATSVKGHTQNNAHFNDSIADTNYSAVSVSSSDGEAHGAHDASNDMHGVAHDVVPADSSLLRTAVDPSTVYGDHCGDTDTTVKASGPSGTVRHEGSHAILKTPSASGSFAKDVKCNFSNESGMSDRGKSRDKKQIEHSDCGQGTQNVLSNFLDPNDIIEKRTDSPVPERRSDQRKYQQPGPTNILVPPKTPENNKASHPSGTGTDTRLNRPEESISAINGYHGTAIRTLSKNGASDAAESGRNVLNHSENLIEKNVTQHTKTKHDAPEGILPKIPEDGTVEEYLDHLANLKVDRSDLSDSRGEDGLSIIEDDDGVSTIEANGKSNIVDSKDSTCAKMLRAFTRKNRIATEQSPNRVSTNGKADHAGPKAVRHEKTSSKICTIL